MTEQRFRNVMRGYDPNEVDAVVAMLQRSLEESSREAGEATVSLTKLESQAASMQSELSQTKREIARLQAERQSASSEPTFAELGERIGTMLTLAREEAVEIVTTAKIEASEVVTDAQREAELARAGADRYAADLSSKAEAEGLRLVESARRQANDILDHADREASARRGEAEAYYEQQQARAAAAAAEFEQSLAVRRDKAAADFATQMEHQEEALEAAHEERTAVEAEAQRLLTDANAQVEGMIANAQKEAASLVDKARGRADRIRRETERELTAITARRDSINNQLSNVRQMLATLGGNVDLVEEIVPMSVPAFDPPVDEIISAEVEAEIDSTGHDGQTQVGADAQESGVPGPPRSQASSSGGGEADEAEGQKDADRQGVLS